MAGINFADWRQELSLKTGARNHKCKMCPLISDYKTFDSNAVLEITLQFKHWMLRESIYYLNERQITEGATHENENRTAIFAKQSEDKKGCEWRKISKTQQKPTTINETQKHQHDMCFLHSVLQISQSDKLSIKNSKFCVICSYFK